MISKRGIVTAARMQNTVTVTVHRSVLHALYKKSYRSSKKFLADTAGQDLGVGDEVVIVECRPLSKRKHFKVSEVLKRAPRVSEMTESKEVQEAMHRTKQTSATPGAGSSSSAS